MFSTGCNILLTCAASICFITIAWRLIEPQDDIIVIESNMLLKRAKHIMYETLYYFREDLRPKAPQNWFERHIVWKFRMLF